MDRNQRIRRAENRRRTAILRRGHLQNVESELSPLDGAAAISLVNTLTRESWSVSRQPWPTYVRSQIPIRFVPGRLT